jgi:Fic family protein
MLPVGMAFAPKFTIPAESAKSLMRIEAARVAVENLPITSQLLGSLRQSARLLTTHFSTQIEGNQLTMAEVEKVVIDDKQSGLPGRERDEMEVRNYYRALEHVEALSERWEPISERDIRVIHGLVMEGRGRPTPYRDGQNVISDSVSDRIVYLPPECVDVPVLMEGLVAWLEDAMDEQRAPAPVIAAIAHYQFATIHPYYDGNGRTARLLANLVLHRCGYGLKGIYSLEEYYSRNLPAYYAALSLGSHNYYDGRDNEDITPFVSYFVEGMAIAFEKVKQQAERQSLRTVPPDRSFELRELRPRQRQVLELFREFREVTSAQVGEALAISPRQARELCARWVADDFLVVGNPSNRARTYRLAERWESLLDR